MKISVIYIYWFLLLISVISSCLLFILVAAEGIKSSENKKLDDGSEQINNFEGGNTGQLTPNPETEAPVNERAELKASFEEISQEIEQTEPNKDFLLAQNSGVVLCTLARMSMPVYLVAPMSSPAKGVALYFTIAVIACCVSNLLNRLSDTGQAVVFTLVDTASAELQQRADADALPAAHVTAHQSHHHVAGGGGGGQGDNGSLPGLNYTPTVLVSDPPPATAQVQGEGERGGGDRKGEEKGVVGVEKNEEGNHTDAESSSITIQSESSYVVRAEPKVITDKEDPLSPPPNTTQSQPSVLPPPPTQEIPDQQSPTPEPVDQEKEVPEDILSYSEWTQKQLQEDEKKKEKVNTSAQSSQPNKNSSNLKLRSKNYASPDCGAKIVAANPEAISAGSVLSPSRDEYKLNTCTSRIWFIVELCEAIQAKKIDLANFELFSSSPKDFTVSVADRFPSRDWSSVGQFQAKDERDIQSFNLHPHLFGKFIKVEMLSHWGSEHFCPISLFRVYGTSEFEVLETEDLQETIPEDDDEDETLDFNKGEASNNLFGSARDAVMSIVKKAAEVLVKSNDNSNQTIRSQSVKYSPLINTCSTPSHIVVCDNCSDILFGNVYELLSCKSNYLHNLVSLPIVTKSLYNTDICVEYGLNFFSKTTDRHTDSQCSYISNFLAPKYIAALCNVLAVLENKVVLNVSSQYSNASSIIDNDTLSTNNFEVNSEMIDDIPVSACVSNEISEVKTCASIKTDSNIESKATVIIEKSFVEESSELQIKPTKTLSKDPQLDSSYHQEIPKDSSIIPTGQDLGLDPSETAQLPLEASGSKNVTEEEPMTDQQQATVTLPEDNSAEAFEYGHDQLDKLLSELNLDTDEVKGSTSTTVAPPSNVPQQAQKESVFLRLSNRIKALERNMSLSSQYLEELSRRYKKQVEDMQRAFEKKLSVLAEDNKRRDDDHQALQLQISRLSSSIEALLTERDSLWRTASLLGQFLLIEVVITCILFYFCWRSPDGGLGQGQKNKGKKLMNGQVKRRKSIDTIGHESPVVNRKRRPSEEALKISGTYKDLLITDEVDSTNGVLTKAEKRRRRKKNALLRSQSVVACQYKLQVAEDEPTRRASSSEMNRSLLVQELMNGDVSPPVRIQEIPFVLEESEHSSVEPIDYFTPPTSDANLTNLTAKVTKNGSLKSAILKSHSPLFMKTALSSRTKRSSTKRLSLFKTDKTRSSPDSSIKSVGNSFSMSDSQDDQTSLNSDSSKKDKKLGGFKRMFKKVF